MAPQSRSAETASVRAIVVARAATGSGGSTLCLAIAASLMAQGQRVATIDLDALGGGLARGVARRREAAQHRSNIPLPSHIDCVWSHGDTETDVVARAITAAEPGHDFVVLDAPSVESPVGRIACALADVLLTPFVLPHLDLACDAAADPDLFAAGGIASIGGVVAALRRERRLIDGTLDWMVVRNRLPSLRTPAPGQSERRLRQAALEHGFRVVDGLGERSAHRTVLAHGLTALDRRGPAAPAVMAERDAAGEEIGWLVEALKLPLDAAARRHAARQAEWEAYARQPIVADDLLSV